MYTIAENKRSTISHFCTLSVNEKNIQENVDIDVHQWIKLLGTGVRMTLSFGCKRCIYHREKWQITLSLQVDKIWWNLYIFHCLKHFFEWKIFDNVACSSLSVILSTTKLHLKQLVFSLVMYFISYIVITSCNIVTWGLKLVSSNLQRDRFNPFISRGRLFQKYM